MSRAAQFSVQTQILRCSASKLFATEQLVWSTEACASCRGSTREEQKCMQEALTMLQPCTKRVHSLSAMLVREVRWQDLYAAAWLLKCQKQMLDAYMPGLCLCRCSLKTLQS